ncbi:PAS domain S-box protein [Eudoraea adriatica]|uniref:PAS domain S-box protein n=1 Tax=Eudoraea adriatica TaxID=446681 RepID=UPI0003A08207|nr:PAS domain S-box protein [Eudoraea adriatica]
MMDNRITLVGNYGSMLPETQTSSNNYLIKQLPVPMAFVNTKFKIIHASDKWVTDFDFSNRDVIGMSLFELFEDISKSWKKDLNSIIKGKAMLSGVENFYDSQNNEKWFEWVNVPWYDERENIIGVIIQSKDITDTIFDDIKLEKLEVLLKDKSKISKIGSWEYDAIKDRLTWCKITKKLHEVAEGFEPDMESGISFYKEGYSRNTIAMAVDNAMTKGVTWNETLQLITAKGKEISVIATGKPVFKNDKFLGMIGTFQDITDEVMNKAKTEEQERIFSSIFNSSYQFTGILDTEGTFLEINETALQFSGLKQEAIVKRKFWDAYWWPIPDMVKEGLKQVIAAAARGEFMRSEIVVLDKNKQPIPVDFSLKPIHNENGKVVSLLAEGRMIKEMVEARQKLKISEQKFRSLYELSPIAYILSDFETGEILDFNSSFEKATAYGKGDMEHLRYPDLVPDSSKHKLINFLKEVDLKGTYGPFQHLFSRKDGTTYPVLISGSLVGNKKGRKLLWSTAQDISEVKKKEKQIRGEQKLLKTLIDNLPLNVYIKDLESRKVLVNKSEIIYCGFKEEAEVLGKNDFDFYDEKSALISREEDLSVMNSLKPILGKETISVKKDGSLIRFMTSKIPLIGPDGKASGLIGISMDISDLKQQEQELRDLINVTSIQNKQLINFAHIVSHNLRSHTANFSMLLEFLVDEKDANEQANLIKMLTEASDNLLETLDNLNEVVAISTNLNLDKKPVNLNEKVAAAEKNLAAFLKKNKAKIINKIPDETYIKVIPAYIDSILMNFITNAVKYKDDNRNPIIKLTVSKNEKYTILSIEDNGLGIDLNKYGEKLFGMYKTFHDNSDARGIGLYITKNQIEAMNGKVMACSEVNKGTTFNIYFNDKT